MRLPVKFGVPINVRINPEMEKQLRAEAQQRGQSLSEQIRQAIIAHLPQLTEKDDEDT